MPRPITDQVLKDWEPSWGKRLPDGSFDGTHGILWEFIQQSPPLYLVILKSIGKVAWETQTGGNPNWRPRSEYYDGRMVEPDMDLDEIHLAQSLMEE